MPTGFARNGGDRTLEELRKILLDADRFVGDHIAPSVRRVPPDPAQASPVALLRIFIAAASNSSGPSHCVATLPSMRNSFSAEA
jgi:hypothetical protein